MTPKSCGQLKRRDCTNFISCIENGSVEDKLNETLKDTSKNQYKMKKKYNLVSVSFPGNWFVHIIFSVD